MRQLFPGYHKPTAEELQRMWQNCTFTFDANVFLNIYKYTSNTREEFLKVLEDLKDRLWIPHQAALEYFKNRSSVIESQLNSYDNVTTLLDQSYESLKKQLGVVRRHASIKVDSLLSFFQTGIDAAKNSLAADKQHHPDSIASHHVGNRIESLIQGRVGTEFDTETLAKIYTKADLRYRAKQPPGYKDVKDKDYPSKYNDVVMWFQVIDYAKQQEKPVIFITDEEQEDWWQIEKGEIISPRPELRNEIQTEARVTFWMYSSEQFIDHAKDFLKADIPEAAVQEVSSVRHQDRAYRSAIDYFAAQDSITRRYIQNSPAINNLLLRRASEMSNALQNPRTVEAIKNFRAFDDPINPVMRKSMEERLFVDNSLLRQKSEAIRAVQMPQMLHASEISKMLDQQRLYSSETRKWFSDPFRSSLAEAALWPRRSLSGWPIHREPLLEIFPKTSSSPGEGTQREEVRVEIQEWDQDTSTEEDTFDVDQLDVEPATNAYELYGPLTITVTHRADSERPYKSLHRLRRPTTAEWLEWTSNIECNRRYYSKGEIDEYNANKDEEDEKATEIWEPFYSEWQANERLYDKLFLEIAGAKIDKDDKFPPDQFRELPPEIIENLAFEIKSVVITKLYGCYSELAKDASDERRVVQTLDHASESFDIIHILRRPTKDQWDFFRADIVTGYFSKKEDREIVELKLNLTSAIELYDHLLVTLENATINGTTFSEKTRGSFVQAVNPIYKLRVLEALFNVKAWYFKFDDIIMP